MRYSILLVLALLAGCDPVTGQIGDTDGALPQGATDIKNEGHGWTSFKWNGNCFLINANGGALTHSYDRAFTQYECKATDGGTQ